MAYSSLELDQSARRVELKPQQYLKMSKTGVIDIVGDSSAQNLLGSDSKSSDLYTPIDVTERTISPISSIENERELCIGERREFTHTELKQGLFPELEYISNTPNIFQIDQNSDYCGFCDRYSNLVFCSYGNWFIICNICGERLRQVRGLLGGLPIYRITSQEDNINIVRREIVLDLCLNDDEKKLDPDDYVQLCDDNINNTLPLRTGEHKDEIELKMVNNDNGLSYTYDYVRVGPETINPIRDGEIVLRLDEYPECSICFDPCLPNDVFTCRHPIHLRCLHSLVENRLREQPLATYIRCPICRAHYNILTLFPHINLVNQNQGDVPLNFLIPQGNDGIVALFNPAPELEQDLESEAPSSDEDEAKIEVEEEVPPVYVGVFRTSVHGVPSRFGYEWAYFQFVEHLRNAFMFGYLNVYYNPILVSILGYEFSLIYNVFIDINIRGTEFTIPIGGFRYLFYSLYPLFWLLYGLDYIRRLYNWYFYLPFRFVLGYRRTFDDLLGEDIAAPMNLPPGHFDADYVGQNGLVGQENRRIRVLLWEQFPFPTVLGMSGRIPSVTDLGSHPEYMRLMNSMMNCQFPKGLVDQIIGHFPRMMYDNGLVNYRLTEHYCMGLTRQFDITAAQEMHCNMYAPAVAYLVAWNRRVDLNEILMARYITLKKPVIMALLFLAFLLYNLSLEKIISNIYNDYYPVRVGLDYIGYPTINSVEDYNWAYFKYYFFHKPTFFENIQYFLLYPINSLIYKFSFNKVVVDCHYWGLSESIFIQCRFTAKTFLEHLTSFIPSVEVVLLCGMSILLQIQGPLTFVAIFGAVVEELFRVLFPEYFYIFIIIGLVEALYYRNAWHFYLHVLMISLSFNPVICLMIHILINMFTTTPCSILVLFVTYCHQYVIYLSELPIISLYIAQIAAYPFFFPFFTLFAAGIIKMAVGLLLIAIML